ncbi:hypothetical protein scyTo_0009942 [Scyliorhinus torazame]|uniref:Uncharacterized protein n=1 Tax=Scyliorhinus torazame TaxID=75743 RepID=A0A401NWQ4_SCYTO|nr:hypothetical protein [Scyliorhinus torazame]
MVSKGTGRCVRQLYDICRAGSSRNQEGTCLTADEWAEYCSLKVCASPVDYQGFDGVLGLCVCRTAGLDSLCNRKCRRLQRGRLQITCKGEAHFRITDRNGLKVDVPWSHLGRVLNSGNAIEESQCPPQYGFSQPVHLVEISDSILKNNEFWDYERQIDLEFFNTNTFYRILLRQSLAVSVRISQHKNEVKKLYQKIAKETNSLRELWMERMNFAGRGMVINKKDMAMYVKICHKMRLEIERRKHIGLEFQEILNKQQELLHNDWRCREEHQVTFSTTLRAAVLLLEERIDNSEDRKALLSTRDPKRVAGQIEALMLQMSDAITNECQRLNTWALLGEGIGAQLVSKKTSIGLSKEELIGVVCQREEHVIPYVSHPQSRDTGLPVKLQLRSLHRQSELKLGGPIADAKTGIEVPILAVTIHLQTGLVYPLGGTYISPATNMLAPIEIGAPMVHKKTGQVVPIIGVGLDTSTGMVVPLGGVLEPSKTPLILGDSFSEPLSGKSAQIAGVYIQETRVLPHAGGYQALLDSALLVCEIRALEALKEYKDSSVVQETDEVACPQKQRSRLMDALESLVKARTRSWAHIIHTEHNLERQRKEAKDLADKGGSVGLIPITLGARSIDEITGELGPVVGARIDPQTRIVVPVTQSSGSSSRRKPAGGMLDALEEELNCRRAHWHLQRHKEEALHVDLKGLIQVSDTKADCKFEKVEEDVTALEDTIDMLQDSAQSEAQRRDIQDSHFASLMPNDIVLLVSHVNKEEAEQQLLYLAMAQTFLEKVTQFLQKMRGDESRQRGQLKELQEGIDRHAEESSRRRYQQVKSLLTREFQKNMMSRWTGLDMVYIRLEHIRDLAELCVLEAKVPETNLLLASSLPTNKYTRNAFRNSFFYQHSQKTLFIRRQRLASVGDFSLLLVHCLSHLAADELNDDSNPQFLRIFHQALKALFEDMFFLRFRIPPTSNALNLRASTTDKLFQNEFDPEIYTDAISDLLNIKLKDPKTLAFFAEHLQRRTAAGKSNTTGTPVKDLRAKKIIEHLQGQSEIQRSNGDCFESKSELDLEDIEEKIDNVTMELTAVFETEQEVQESTVSVSKKIAFLKEIEELEAEFDSRGK